MNAIDLSMVMVRTSPKTGQRMLVSTEAFEPGDVICPFGARETLDEPTYLTVQTGEHTHILLYPEELQYANHSCDPNIFFDTTSMQVFALKQIAPDEELMFFYPSTEWSMAQPFQCYCGSARCLGSIQGAAFIPRDVLNTYKLTDFILGQLRGQSGNTSL